MSLMINKIASMRSQLADQQFGSFVLRKASVGVSPFTATLLGKIASGVKISSIEKLAFSYKDLPAQARNGIFIVSAYTTKVKDNMEDVTEIPEDEWFRNKDSIKKICDFHGDHKSVGYAITEFNKYC